MKKILLMPIVLFGLTLTSCLSFKEVGRLNMVSCRNIDTHTSYQLLQKNIEYTKKELRHVKSTTIEQAVDDVVKKVEGGEYLMNAKIRMCVIAGSLFTPPSYFYAVEGDVWGVPPTKK